MSCPNHISKKIIIEEKHLQTSSFLSSSSLLSSSLSLSPLSLTSSSSSLLSATELPGVLISVHVHVFPLSFKGAL